MWVARGHVESPDIVINQARNENTLNIQESGPGSGSVLLSFISHKLILVKLCVAIIYIQQAHLGQALCCYHLYPTSSSWSSSALLSFISRKLILVKLCVAIFYIPQAHLHQVLYYYHLYPTSLPHN